MYLEGIDTENGGGNVDEKRTTTTFESAPNTARGEDKEEDVARFDWSIWKTIDELEKNSKIFYPELTPKIVEILKQVGSKYDGIPAWRSLLNKSGLYHEVEESIVALHYFFQGTSHIINESINDKTVPIKSQRNTQKVIALDVCGGKGLFSFLMSHLRPSHVDHIILLEKANINWHHLLAINETADEEGRPKIVIWAETNLHDYDQVLDRLLSLRKKIALTGIHLCKQLGPSFCSLANGLGNMCTYACLAPCCMPRVVTKQKRNKKKQQAGKKLEGSGRKNCIISVYTAETSEERIERRDYMERRSRMRPKPTTGPCFYCDDPLHTLPYCVEVKKLDEIDQIPIRRDWHAATIPCWNCMEYGHYKQDCPKPKIPQRCLAPPKVDVDVSDILVSSSRPFATYCQLLANSIRGQKNVQVVETKLKQSADTQHQEGNWNKDRKSIFIVAC